MKPSVIILARNEEQTIRRCIESVIDIADEIVVIDDMSDDKTAAIAKKLGNARVVSHKLVDFASQRNFAETQVKGDWILFLDADEALSAELRQEIQSMEVPPGYFAFYLRRRDFFWGAELKHGETSSARNKGFIRLYRRGSGKWEGVVHEKFVTNAETRQLGAFIDHHPHQSIAEFLTDVNRYSTFRANELKKAGVRAGWMDVSIRPAGKFAYNYFLKLGFLDGPAGFVYAFMMSFHSFLVRSKLYQYTEITS